MRSHASRLKTDGERVDERRTKRTTRRLMVRFGQGSNEKTGFTRNISETGLFLQTGAVFSPGSTIQVSVHFPEKTWTLWARVAWAKRVPPQLTHILECGMGVHFVEPGEEWRGFFEDWKKKNGLA